jgi:hypothetical protein
MYIRRKSNKTGSVSVQVISKHTGRYQVLRSFGTGRTEQELVRLEEHARQFISSQSGFVGELFADEDEVRLEDFLSTLHNTQIKVIGPELIFTKTMYQLTYQLPKSKIKKSKILAMDKQQKELYNMTEK